MRYQDIYQSCLILCAFLVVLGIGVFVYREMFPEYKKYQSTYQHLEAFRASYTGIAPPPFKKEVKQIYIPNEQKGIEVIDRCTSCHVAMDLPHFSQAQIARDVNGKVVVDREGNPVSEPNPDYVWGKLEQRIRDLRNPDLLVELREEGKNREANQRLREAEHLESLRFTEIDGKKVDMSQVIAMHPLIGRETRPFEHHPLDKYGCTSCHNGNGRSVVAKRAHGPFFEYEKAYETSMPAFTESDPKNDPAFARMYNDKPAHDLIFQTTPLYAGPLMDAKCVQCHQPTGASIESMLTKIALVGNPKKEAAALLSEGANNDKMALKALLKLAKLLDQSGYEGTVSWLKQALGDDSLTSEQIDAYENQLAFIQKQGDGGDALYAVKRQVERIAGSEEQADFFLKAAMKGEEDSFLDKKEYALDKDEKALNLLNASMEPLEVYSQNKEAVLALRSNVDRLLSNYIHGKELFISQACYACHRIAGFSRSSVGPELTYEGYSYPWFVKEVIVWPQGQPANTMPNFRLDHEEVGDLMAFIMAQKGDTKAISEIDYEMNLKSWEGGAKMPWEKAVSPTSIQNVKEGVITFASEGCASCHKLKGFDPPMENEWFGRLFPENLLGSQIAEQIEKHAHEIDEKQFPKQETLEEIEKKFPGLIEAFYSNFKFAARARNAIYQEEPEKLEAYKQRVRKVLLYYINAYGLGRDIGPRLFWSGVYRNSAWLMGHFKNPAGFTARSIMPVMPFDDTKFYMLTHMLQELGNQNRDYVKEMWKKEGFDPESAYEMLCSSCHGNQRDGNGSIAEWIYPFPKDLRNPAFLRGLTKERVIESIEHGVKGSPMPPWGEGENPVLSANEIDQLTCWLFQGLPPIPRAVKEAEEAKWRYTAEDAVKEMKKEGELLQPIPSDPSLPSYFRQEPNPNSSIDVTSYYIKEIYYTPDNLKAGEEFFNINCAVCHGKEGAGTGVREEIMIEAKPRMFTNLPWIRSRDDLRLLRSIKFGVPGTSMVPWGDQTSSMQRMQLVMHIRELTRRQLLLDDLQEVLYQAFDTQIQIIEAGRAKGYAQMEALEKNLREKEEALALGMQSSENIGDLYRSVVDGKKELTRMKGEDQLYLRIIQLVQDVKKIYYTLGSQMIEAKVSENTVRTFFSMIEAYPLTYSLRNGQLVMSVKEEKEMAISEQGMPINLKTKLQVELVNAKQNRKEQMRVFREIEAHGNKNSL